MNILCIQTILIPGHHIPSFTFCILCTCTSSTHNVLLSLSTNITCSGLGKERWHLVKFRHKAYLVRFWRWPWHFLTEHKLQSFGWKLCARPSTQPLPPITSSIQGVWNWCGHLYIVDTLSKYLPLPDAGVICLSGWETWSCDQTLTSDKLGIEWVVILE